MYNKIISIVYSEDLMLISTPSYQGLEIIIQKVSCLVGVSLLLGRTNLSPSVTDLC